MDKNESIRLELLDDESIGVITIDRPPVNALDSAAYMKLAEVSQTVSRLSSLRVVIITGAGKRAFIAGSDVKEYSELNVGNGLDRARLVRRAYEAVQAIPVPIIGALNGPILGVGVAIASYCDILIAAENAYISLPEIDRGRLGGTRHMSDLVPRQVMRWMAYTGGRVSASQLLSFGTVHQVFPNEELLEGALELARMLCAKSRNALRLQKEALSLSEEMPRNSGAHIEQLFTTILSGYSDSTELANAFLEKRAASFDDK